jgi:propane 2-monooxygenase large subunit
MPLGAGRRLSRAKLHEKIQELSWSPSFATPAAKYPTDYRFERSTKRDPMRQVLRSYFPMEEEKDQRVYGAVDGAIRGNMFREVSQRWMEWQKLFLSVIPFAEISAARAMPLAVSAVPNPEVHNGLAVQMIDEMRHSTIQMNLKRIYLNHYIDPAGFDVSGKAFATTYAGQTARQFGEGFISGDAITAASVELTIVAETAFTNVLFVAMPAEAAANGDYLLPTVFQSVQSDESRHISNGYAIILMALADDRNHDLLERDLRYAWWHNHAIVDATIGTFIEYGTKDRRKDRDSYAEAWRRWIYDDYYRSYLMPLERYGLKVPHDLVEEAWKRIWNKGYVHEVAQFLAANWPLHYWRIDPLTDEDFEWFESKYPGWYAKYGEWWENYRLLRYPGGYGPITFAEVNYQHPLRCWTCMVPCLIREDTIVDEVDGEWRSYCSATCHWTDKVAFREQYKGRATPAMGRLTGERDWETRYHHRELPDVQKEVGIVRDDGTTLIPQPHLDLDDPSKLWTLDDFKGYVVVSPNKILGELADAQRERFVSDYKAGGPGGRFAPTDRLYRYRAEPPHDPW